MFSTQPSALMQGDKANYPSTAVKELGLIQRIEGVRSGLDQIHSHLTVLAERISGSGSSEAKSEPLPSGIPHNLTVAEQRIRQILSLLDTFNNTF